MAFPIALAVVGLGLGALLIAGGASADGGKKSPSGEPSPVLTPEVLTRLLKTRYLSEKAEAGSTVYLYSPKSAGRRAIDSLIERIENGDDAYTNISIIGSGDFGVAYRRAGSAPPGEDWFILATSADLPVLRATAAGNTPALQQPEVKPATTPATTPAPRTTTGIPDVDRRMTDPATTPAQLWAIADALEESGKKEEAGIVRRRGDELYAELRAKHAARGGTPFVVREGLFPANVAKHYGGTLAQLKASNPGKDIVTLNKDWVVGREFLLPLAWDAERKPPPTPVTGKKTTTAAAAKPSTSASASMPDQYKPLPYPSTGPH